MPEEILARLEACLDRFLERARELQEENSELRRQIKTLEQELEELKRENSLQSEVVKKLKDDRLRIRSRVEKIEESLAALEKPLGV